MNFSAAYAGSRPAQVDFSGTVTSAARFFYGKYSHATHEAFNVATTDGPVEIVDNVKIGPRVPVTVGDCVEVRGEMVHDPGKIPIVHWTHHDPQRTHPDGFIRLDGATYA
jgi:hypothetical protein